MNDLQKQDDMITESVDAGFESLRSRESDRLLQDSTCNLKKSDESSCDEGAPRNRIFKRFTRFSDSDSDCDRDKTSNGAKSGSEDNSSRVNNSPIQESDDSTSAIIVNENLPFKSRIQSNGNLSGSEDSESNNSNKNKEQQLRMKNKRSKLRNKFKSLVTSRGKEVLSTNMEDDVTKKSAGSSSSESGDEMASIEKIKQKIRERMTFKPSICDPDTSDEESNQQKSVYKQKKERKMTKPTSPKHQRMSAKQAMENMQKIKSESNRMLREKEVSLPYHRPKALSLKDIMSRRKLAVTSDGKALPIKMNEHQLRQYAQMLEERQKEMIELCKSESEEEETNENLAEVVKDTAINDVNDAVNPEYPNERDSAETANNINNISHTDNNISNGTIEQDNKTETAEKNCLTDKDAEQLPIEQDSETSMRLVYNDSADSLIDDGLIDEEKTTSAALDSGNTCISDISKSTEPKLVIANEIASKRKTEEKHEDSIKTNTEIDSQLISLHFDTENTDNSIGKNDLKSTTKAINTNTETDKNNSEYCGQNGENEVMEIDHQFSDDDINLEDIDNIIENAEIIKDIEDKVNSQFLVRDKPLNVNPKLTGAPGMVIDLDESDAMPRKSGIELLKERFTYFCKLKTPEEMEREREKKLKPGTQLKQLKLELEEKIAEQRSLEWAKRLEDEKQLKKEMNEYRGEETDEDDIDKIEAAIEEKEEVVESEKSGSEEEEPIEDDIEIKDKPRKKNAMLDDEAEESDCDENEEIGANENRIQNDEHDEIDADNDDDDDENESESGESDESSESEVDEPTTKKGRILKAFEDSDDEDSVKTKDQPVIEIEAVKETVGSKSGSSDVTENFLGSQAVSQDIELQLAQRPKSTSDDLFTSQESALIASEAKEQSKYLENDETFTQTFSILDSTKAVTADLDLNGSDKLTDIDATRTLDIENLDDINALCPVTDSQNLPLPSQMPTQFSQSQTIGDDIVALCTGQFYNNQFVSQLEGGQIPQRGSQNYDAFDNYQPEDSQEDDAYDSQEVPASIDIGKENCNANNAKELTKAESLIELNSIEDNKENRSHTIVDDNLKSILDELGDPEFDSPKPNKFFVGSKTIKNDVQNETQLKKKFVIDSDEENDEVEANKTMKSKKIKKKKPEKRALQISDDEEEESEQGEVEEFESEIEEDDPEQLVEYDSEENEIVVKPQNPKKKRKMTEFFENEAELTSEDEWVGSGDEDEAGLDRMEREEGDDETFHQGQLQRELGQIHMRDVLDQDKREVRLIQELLFEDGDLGGGGRQRKFRWNNIDGDAESGTVPDEFADTQEEEFESEEQWRKQRHERETFLREMKNKDDPDESLNFSVHSTTLIQSNTSNNMSSLYMDVNEKTEIVVEKTAKDFPSPKKPFGLLQQSYQGSLLSRGRGALARLAALATPLATDDDGKVGTLGPSSRRNFVFTAITPEEKEPKVKKRKAESNPSTPKLLKMMRTEEKQNTTRSSLLDHFEL